MHNRRVPPTRRSSEHFDSPEEDASTGRQNDRCEAATGGDPAGRRDRDRVRRRRVWSPAGARAGVADPSGAELVDAARARVLRGARPRPHPGPLRPARLRVVGSDDEDAVHGPGGRRPSPQWSRPRVPRRRARHGRAVRSLARCGRGGAFRGDASRVGVEVGPVRRLGARSRRGHGREPRTRPRPDQHSSGDSAPTYWPTSSLPAPTRGCARRSSTTNARPRARRPRATCSRVAYDLDISDDLARITAPTLVVHRDRDRAAPLEQGRALAAGIPGASLEVLDGRDHLPYIGDAAGLATSIRRFLGLPAARAGSATALTERQQQVARLVTRGPDEPRDRRRADHHRTLRRVARRAHPRSPRVPVALPGRGLVHRRRPLESAVIPPLTWPGPATRLEACRPC